MQMRGMNSCVIAFDISNRKSFENCVNWAQLCTKYSADGKLNGCLVATKTDRSEDAKVSIEEAEALAKQLNIEFFATSSVRPYLHHSQSVSQSVCVHVCVIYTL
jgi:GTPase SAR1 family protein